MKQLLTILMLCGVCCGYAQNTPPYAASTKTRVIENADGTIKQTWSDAIQVPGCDKKSFTDSYTVPHCRSYTEGADTWYYYNWPYVDKNAELLCPSPWRVPSAADFCALDKALFNTATCADRAEASPDVTAKYITAWGGSYGGNIYNTTINHTGSHAYYWSSTANPGDTLYAHYLYFLADGYVAPQISYNKYFGFQVRCVK
jgi:uncharacterized protein (TIGR02145 family)